MFITFKLHTGRFRTPPRSDRSKGTVKFWRQLLSQGHKPPDTSKEIISQPEKKQQQQSDTINHDVILDDYKQQQVELIGELNFINLQLTL